MKLVEYPSKTEWKSLLARPHFDRGDLTATVDGVLSDVRDNGDAAVKRYEAKFDHVELNDLAVSEAEIAEAEALVSDELKSAILAAKENIAKFHAAQDQPLPSVETMPGVRCWQKAVAIQKVGLYIPGGTAPLFSTVLMLAVPAQIAGCKEIVLCSPPAADGKIPLLQQERLLDLGKWLEINGEAIYGTRPYKKFYEMKDVKVERTDATINFDWKRNSPDPAISCDHFKARWQGEFFCPEDTYTFEIQTDDFAKLIIDGKTVIEDTRKCNIGTTQLSGLQHTIDLIYEENDLEATITLYWSSKTKEKQVMSDFLTGEWGCFGNNNQSPSGLNATYTCKQPAVCYTQGKDALYAIALDYPENELVLDIEQPADDMIVTMLGCNKPFPWEYKDGKLHIDTKYLQYSDLKSTAAWVFKMK